MRRKSNRMGGEAGEAWGSKMGAGRRWLMALFTLLLLILVSLLVRYGAGPGMPLAVMPTQPPQESPAAEALYAPLREVMVSSQIELRGVSDPEVLRAMRSVPRHEFVPGEYLGRAYEDGPLPIGYGQTISQPYIVALMTELLRIKRGDKVLEVGTGSGYQAAILAELTDEVYSLEIIPELAQSAAERLKRLGYGKVKVANLDGYFGWEEHAPYDAIIVTCAPDHVPPPLLQQLKDGGRLVIPVGPPGAYQTLWLIARQGDEYLYKNYGGVAFVPLTGERQEESP